MKVEHRVSHFEARSRTAQLRIGRVLMFIAINGKINESTKENTLAGNIWEPQKGEAVHICSSEVLLVKVVR